MTSPAWKKLQDHARQMQTQRIAGLFDADKNRFDKHALRLPGLIADFSKNKMNDETLALLMELAREKNLEAEKQRMFAGEPINVSENRPVLHVACRAGNDAPDIIINTLAQMKRFTDDVRSGKHKGFSSKEITDIVTIGIGGSTLGPEAVIHALKHWHHPRLKMHFVTNVEASGLHHVLQSTSPETTLFVISSKSFTTPETMMNANHARAHVVKHFGSEKAVANHFVALSTNGEAVEKFGIAPDNMFQFKNWVGGRFSGWSAIGLPIMLMVGAEAFSEWLAGAHEMDTHFQTAPLEKNIPVLLGMIGIWYRNFMDYPAYGVVPYHSELKRLPAWLQQVDMESNGKSVLRAGAKADIKTGPIVFGEPGTDAQHSFFQWVHQSADILPVDFIGVVNTPYGENEQHRMLLAHMLAQAESLMTGKEDTAEPHRNFTGDKPSTSFLLDELTPRTLGMVMSMYEMKIYVQGIIWDINSFDQFGVELGKVAAKKIEEEMVAGSIGPHDSSTAGLMAYITEKKSETAKPAKSAKAG